MDASLRQQVRETTRDVGERIRAARALRQTTQSDLGAALGVSFQQVQKYENGKNRVSVSTLLKIAEVTGLEVSYFLPDGSAPIGRSELVALRGEVEAAIHAADNALSVITEVRKGLQAAVRRLALPTSP